MVKKLKKMAEQHAAGVAGSPLAQSVKDSAQQIWLAGMGAFAKAQEEGGKVFEALVREGASLQRKTQTVAEDRLGEMGSRMSAMADGVSAKAGQQWDKLESIFEERVAKAMSKLGVPARQDVQSLMERIDRLAAQVERLGKAPTPKTAARTAAPSPKAGAKAAAKKAATGAAKTAARPRKTVKAARAA